jgi:uncharacterized protein YcfL
MKKTLFISLLSVLVALSMSSCRTPSAGLVVESYPKTKITVNSKMCGQKLEVVQYAAAKRNGLLEAQITLQNTTSKDFACEYMYRWLDKNGMEITSAVSTWKQVSISSKQKLMLNAIAPSKDVEDFMIDIRFFRSSTRW